MSHCILVTGGAGYIGSHACKALARAGYTPVALDNLCRGNKKSVQWGSLEVGDIRDKQFLLAAFKKYRPAAVMHFAALAYVGESFEKPGDYYWNNVVGTLTLLDAMVESSVPAIVFSSSCATYGIPAVLPITENAPQLPISPYGMTKLACERMIQAYAQSHSLRLAILRYFNAAGCSPDCEIGENHEPEPHLIPRLLHSAYTGEPIWIFGNDYPTPDGSCVRDYIHVCDLADAHVSACGILLERNTPVVCNLGTGKGRSVFEIVKAVEAVTSRKINCQMGPRRPGDAAELVADAGSAAKVLKWKPTFPDIETIVDHANRWYKKNH